MKNNLFFKILIILFFLFINKISHSAESFTFTVTEIEVLDNGNKIIGTNRGIIKSNNDIVIEGDEFEYDKIKDVLKINGNVKIEDASSGYLIFSDEAIYYKSLEKITTNGNSKFETNNLIIESETFNYLKRSEIINSNKNVIITDILNDYILYSNNITYYKNKELIYSEGVTQAILKKIYNFNSFNVELDRNNKILKSNDKTKIIDKENKEYNFGKFSYYFKEEILKAEDVSIISDNSKPLKNQNKLKFSSGMFDFKNQSFIAENTLIFLDKNSFDNEKNDPRLYGVSSKSYDEITIIDKGIFTSCNIKNGKCPSWSIKAKKITHDKVKKQLSYEKAILKIYDIPVIYFPKFFHPDPTVKRQSGFLQPRFNNSDLNGASINLPYFYAPKENIDFTFSPTIFDSDIKILQTEFRQKNKNSSLIADFGFTDNFKSKTKNKKNSIFHLFADYKKDLNIDGYNKSNLNIFTETTNKDTYLKIFDANLLESSIKPNNQDTLFSGMKLNFDHQKFNLLAGISIYENLYLKNSDKYQFNLPYYNFSKNLINNEIFNIDLTSEGNNYLVDTNDLKSTIVNNLIIQSNKDFFDISEINNNYSLYIKNNNTVGKKNSEYSSNLQNNFLSIIGLNSSIPLVKKTNNYTNLLTPKLTFRINPYDDSNKNYSDLDKKIEINNIFDIDRFGLIDNFESGTSLTLGFDLKRYDSNNLNTFNLSLASNFRDKIENKIPLKTTLNKKNSNIFGSFNYIMNENFKLKYDFSIDNKIENFDYNSIGLNFSLNNFVTDFNFIEENNIIGNANIIENKTTYNLDQNNFISFKTRQNRKINLTEFYDLIYEYKTDCLSASIKYNKTYYEDREIKPTENLMFSISLYPLTTFEQKISPNLYRN